MREGRKAVGREAENRSVMLVWFSAIVLVPLLFGGVVVGDEALLLHMSNQFDQSAKPFGEFARTPGLSYIFHHLLWFGILHASSHILNLFTASQFLKEAILSAETVLAAMCGIALCYTFLIRHKALSISQGMTTVLAFFVGGFGLYTFCLGGAPECYMVLVMAARLFFFESEVTVHRAWKLAICDTLLCALKLYSLLFLVMLLPLFWIKTKRRARTTYFGTIVVLMTFLVLAKLWVWNLPGTYQEIVHLSAKEIGSHFIQQLASPWTGALFCLPVLLTLLWHRPEHRRSLFYKIAALLACMLFFSLYSFFDGDVPGGRYIFPFLIVLLPEIAGAISRILVAKPRVAWLLPLVVFVFLPVGVFGFPYFPNTAFPSLGSCTPDHPAIYSWRIVAANIVRQPSVTICFRHQATTLPVRDASTPRTGPWRVAYMLSGGHSNSYIAVAHNNLIQTQHDTWGRKLSDGLRERGLGSLYLWEFLGLLPAILALTMSAILARKISRPSALASGENLPY